MDEMRSRSYADGRMGMGMGMGMGMEMEPSYAASGLHMMRSYSASYAASHRSASQAVPREVSKPKKGKSTSGSSSSSSSSSSASASSSSSSGGVQGWSLLSDPELQRKKRVAGYKVYAVEGKMKGSFRKSFRWIKDKYTQVLYGRGL